MVTASANDGGRPVLLITGASTGVGEATAELAVEAGYRVALLARSREPLEALADRLGRERTLPIVCDVRSWEEQQAAVLRTIETFGRLDAAFANAGIGSGGDFFVETPELWRDLLLVNVHGAALTARACLPALETARGHLLLCSSTTARSYLPSMYAATKWAITALGHGLRPELAKRRVRVTLLEPGLIDTPFHEATGSSLEDIVEQEGIEQALDAEDVARAALYALTQPPHVAINEILLRPATQIP